MYIKFHQWIHPHHQISFMLFDAFVSSKWAWFFHVTSVNYIVISSILLSFIKTLQIHLHHFSIIINFIHMVHFRPHDKFNHNPPIPSLCWEFIYAIKFILLWRFIHELNKTTYYGWNFKVLDSTIILDRLDIKLHHHQLQTRQKWSSTHQAHHTGWMIHGQKTLFHSIPIPYLNHSD